VRRALTRFCKGRDWGGGGGGVGPQKFFYMFGGGQLQMFDRVLGWR